MYSLNKHEIIDFIIFYLIYFMEYIIIRTKNYKKQGNTKMIIRKFSKTIAKINSHSNPPGVAIF